MTNPNNNHETPPGSRPTGPSDTAKSTPPTVEQAWAGPVAGLARLVDGLRRDLDPLTPVPDRVEELAALLAGLAETVASIASRKHAGPAPTWLLAPTDEVETAGLLDGLAGWMAVVYLRYPDAATGLPDCWCWHPDVVEELVWLMHAWSAAYQGPAASVALAGDWHDRQRPGVVRRIRQSAGSCSRENHQTRPGRPPLPTGAPTVAAVAELSVIAGWWGVGRDQAAPEPANPDVTDGDRS
ncbi:hypothetical protein PSU4_27950 [Pseudonocardia sulfidoxydans NBRC 16205]|uniref:DUF4913 domain-containing protein n=1 Tax=Pseudonocardia sulfidoxydans NBRC 16205 TaxID=1223511 RepID=A0A511DGD3_9PSEU|nr:hypothetical protein [Pseudonocardia sulfidoxydans]GEL23841.1 hypothetical protein PSU4_27950 [Pseudonocardia sulfidoxydans NBRC 16205]